MDIKNIEKNNNDLVNHPAHYCDGGIETIDYITLLKAPFDIGNAIKYISRAGKKEGSSAIQDIEKARFYITHYLEHLSVQSRYMIDDGLTFRPDEIKAYEFVEAKRITDANLIAAIHFIDRGFHHKHVVGLISLLNSARNALNTYIDKHSMSNERENANV